jgi:hypothetical protein
MKLFITNKDEFTRDVHNSHEIHKLLYSRLEKQVTDPKICNIPIFLECIVEVDTQNNILDTCTIELEGISYKNEVYYYRLKYYGRLGGEIKTY